MPASLRELLEHGARMSPEKVVISGAGTTINWADLLERARRVAAALVRDGVQPQDRVVLIAKNDPRYAEILFGCALAGVVLTPLNWRLAPPELASMINDCSASVLFVDEAAVAAVAATSGQLLNVRTIVALDDHASWPSLAQWRAEANDPGVPSGAEDIAFQLYTSGTTGRSKGAMFANGSNVRTLLDDIAVAWGFTDDDVSLVTMPLFHMGGLAWLLAGLARGARAVIVGDFVPAAVVETMAKEQVTMAFCVPAMLAGLCAVPGLAAQDLPLRQMVYSGAPISPEALSAAVQALRCDFVQIYGLTEATGAFAQLSAAEHTAEAALLRSAGRPYDWVRVRAVDPDSRSDVPTGQIGEIWTSSEQNMVGYWHRPQETADALTEDGWLRTGDLGRLDSEGRIFLVDRANDRIITGGENVYPTEVEHVLGAHPDVAEVAVIGVPDDRWGEAVLAFVVPAAHADVDDAALITFARQQLAGFKCPRTIEVVEDLPRTATGKVVKPTLREPYWRGHDRAIN